jgi:hypothetical protein
MLAAIETMPIAVMMRNMNCASCLEADQRVLETLVVEASIARLTTQEQPFGFTPSVDQAHTQPQAKHLPEYEWRQVD